MKKEYWYFISLFAFFLIIFFIRRGDSYKENYEEQVSLYNSITDSLKTYRNKDSLNVSRIFVMQMDKAKDFLEIQNLKDGNLKLQNFINSQGKQIKDLKTALYIANQTTYTDTVRDYYPIGGDTIVFSESVLLDSINNNWINARYGFQYGKSYFTMKPRDEFTIAIKDSKQGYYAEITNLNPYSTTKDIRVFNVAVPKQKKCGIGIDLGFGINYGLSSRKLDYGPYVGLGISYNIIEW
jgi:fructosamine-3-kinase